MMSNSTLAFPPFPPATLTAEETARVMAGLHLQALRELLHAANAECILKPAQRAVIEHLAAVDLPSDPVILQGLRDMVAYCNGAVLAEARGEQIFAIANTESAIEGILANDESSGDEELAQFLAQEFGMRIEEAIEHVKRRDYLQRYLPPVSSRERTASRRGDAP
ncbi:hypothetical protein [Noviherbaspirillum pedocola]|uniref:Uncharacterized protein n=1 Tax=Noviherbaspirillum pedocola TaxID=2801341 RepID=A0A934SZW2_9BURK|nr:hypothetical protein [Noviherbaspirillum pedocola]MBK4736112.1 hypothetical protein [Noviherbaspirillum pedocola]